MQQKKPIGRPFKGNVRYHRNINPLHVKPMDEYLKQLKTKENGNTN